MSIVGARHPWSRAGERLLLAAVLLGLAAALIVLTAALVARSSTPTAIVSGTVYRGPTMPAQRPGWPAEVPVTAGVQARDAAGRVMASTHSNARGHYSLQLAPGAYTLVAIPDAPGTFPLGRPATVVVRAGTEVSVDLWLDTGIRLPGHVPAPRSRRLPVSTP